MVAYASEISRHFHKLNNWQTFQHLQWQYPHPLQKIQLPHQFEAHISFHIPQPLIYNTSHPQEFSIAYTCHQNKEHALETSSRLNHHKNNIIKDSHSILTHKRTKRELESSTITRMCRTSTHVFLGISSFEQRTKDKQIQEKNIVNL